MNAQANAGLTGIFVISWSQCEVDGLARAPLEAITVGASWRWWGEMVQVDGPRDLLVLGNCLGEVERRRSAARKVRKLLGAALATPAPAAAMGDEPMPDQSFSVTDGFSVYVVTVVEALSSGARLLMFSGRIPPAETEMWIVDRAFEAPAKTQTAAGVICFTPGTMIDTVSGRRAVEDLRAGDRVLTCDDGAQELVWVGSRRMTGARLFAMPELRPVRIRSGAYGIGRPDGDLLVSPEHRMLITGAAARALYNETEVLVQARDLVNGTSVRVEQGLTELRYIHLMFERHQVIRANGFESESFHPASTSLDLIPTPQRAGLMDLFPDLAEEPLSYGAYARRALTEAEALILRHDLAA